MQKCVLLNKTHKFREQFQQQFKQFKEVLDETGNILKQGINDANIQSVQLKNQAKNQKVIQLENIIEQHQNQIQEDIEGILLIKEKIRQKQTKNQELMKNKKLIDHQIQSEKMEMKEIEQELSNKSNEISTQLQLKAQEKILLQEQKTENIKIIQGQLQKIKQDYEQIEELNIKLKKLKQEKLFFEQMLKEELQSTNVEILQKEKNFQVFTQQKQEIEEQIKQFKQHQQILAEESNNKLNRWRQREKEHSKIVEKKLIEDIEKYQASLVQQYKQYVLEKKKNNEQIVQEMANKERQEARKVCQEFKESFNKQNKVQFGVGDEIIIDEGYFLVE